MWQKLKQYYPLRFEIIALFLILISVYLVLSSYSSLPDLIPSHFNTQGIPDGFDNKSTLFILLGMNGFMYLMFTGIGILLALVKDPKSVINMPPGWKKNLSDKQLEALRLMTCRFLFFMKLCMQGLFAYILYITIEIANGNSNTLGLPFFLLIAGIFVSAGWMIFRLYKITHEPKTSIPY